ncbi:hypothetical protein D3C85_1442650 [compost metagenome]
MPSVLPPTGPRSRTAAVTCASLASAWRRIAVGIAWARVPVVTVQYSVRPSGDSAMPLMPISSGLPAQTSAPCETTFASRSICSAGCRSSTRRAWPEAKSSTITPTMLFGALRIPLSEM